MFKKFASLFAGGVFLFAMSSTQAAVTFDPTGSGTFDPDPTLALDHFDWFAGNSIAVGGNLAIKNFYLNSLDAGTRPVTFDYFYQAKLSTYVLNDTSFSTMPTKTNLTIIAGLSEKVTAVTGTPGTVGSTASFALSPGKRYFEIYYQDFISDASKKPNDLAGTGFNNGQLILKAVLMDGLYGNGLAPATLTILPNPHATPDPLDSHGPTNSYVGINSVQGTGLTHATATVTDWSTSFFSFNPDDINTIQLTVIADMGINMPYTTVDPSSRFVLGENLLGIGNAGTAPTTIGPNSTIALSTVGTLNAGPIGSGGGNDFVFQTDTSQTFNSIDNPNHQPPPIPEPITAGLGVVSLCGLGVYLVRRRP